MKRIARKPYETKQWIVKSYTHVSTIYIYASNDVETDSTTRQKLDKSEQSLCKTLNNGKK